MNRAAYETVRGKLEAEHFGRVVLLHEGEVAAIYNDSGDAYIVGCEKFGLGNFTTQKIGERPLSLGIHTLYMPQESS